MSTTFSSYIVSLFMCFVKLLLNTMFKEFCDKEYCCIFFKVKMKYNFYVIFYAVSGRCICSRATLSGGKCFLLRRTRSFPGLRSLSARKSRVKGISERQSRQFVLRARKDDTAALLGTPQLCANHWRALYSEPITYSFFPTSFGLFNCRH